MLTNNNKKTKITMMNRNNKQKASPKLFIAPSQTLRLYNAEPITRTYEYADESRFSIDKDFTNVSNTNILINDNNTEDDTNKGHINGISISNWLFQTSISTIGNEVEMESLNAQLEDLANKNSTLRTVSVKGDDETNGDNDATRIQENKSDIRRRLCIPEIVFMNSFVHLKLMDDSNDNHNYPLFEIILNATDALGEWASCHSHLNAQSCYEESKFNCYKGVSIIQSIDAKLWSQRSQQKQNVHNHKIDSNTSCFGQNVVSVNASSEFNYDWTFSTPYTGSAFLYHNRINNKSDNVQWKQSSTSLIELPLLTDQTQPILFFDDINLYEDDMHDNGYVSLKCKIRVMPTCFFILMTLFVRVDHVLVRVKEVRMFCKFPLDGDNKDVINEKKFHRICKDVSWRECRWDQLEELNLPSFVGSWRIEDEQSSQQHIQGLIQRLPSSDLPDSIYKFSYTDI